jgi:polysaccharide biosynthesis protein PslH
MRILLVLPMVPQRDGAGAVPELHHAQVAGLRESHELTVIAPYGDLPGQAEAAEELIRSGLDAEFIDRRRSSSFARRWRVRAELATRWSVSRWPWRTVLSAGGVQPVLDRLAASRTFDVIAVEDTPMSVLRFPRATPVVLTEHEAIRASASGWSGGSLLDRPADSLRRLDWRRWEGFQRRAWQDCNLLQVFSHGDEDAIAERDPSMADRIRVNPFGLVLPEPVDPALEEPLTLLFTGTFTHLPNRDAARWLVEEIVPRVAAGEPGVRLRIVGKGMPRQVRALAGPRVEVVADAPSMRPHLEAASIVLAPVRTGGGMRMKVLQGMAAGKPVVTTRLGAEGFDAMDPDPPLAIAETAEEQAQEITTLLADPARRRDLGRRARAFAERHHSPAAWARRLEEVYEEARAASGRPADSTARR